MKAFRVLAMTILAAMTAADAGAAGIKYQNDKGQSVSLTGYMQFQYRRTDAKGSDAVNDVFLRSLRLATEGSLYENWNGKFQVDFGQGMVSVKDAYMRYECCKNWKVTLGNIYMPFSREVLSGTTQQQMTPTTLVGNHDYGTPDRQVGLHVAGSVLDDKLAVAASVCMAAVDPDNAKLDFDSIVVAQEDDWSQGLMAGGRLEYAPWGQIKFSQGDLEADSQKASIAVGAFTWQNDDENLDPVRSNDVDSVTGVEITGAVRYKGLSVDAECNIFEASLVDDGITAGLYKDSDTELINYAVEGGYMILPSRLEAVVGYEAQDADNYKKTWTKMSGGLNYYVKGHDIKCQLSYTAGENKGGKAGSDVDEVFLQAQYVF